MLYSAAFRCFSKLFHTKTWTHQMTDYTSKTYRHPQMRPDIHWFVEVMNSFRELCHDLRHAGAQPQLRQFCFEDLPASLCTLLCHTLLGLLSATWRSSTSGICSDEPHRSSAHVKTQSTKRIQWSHAAKSDSKADKNHIWGNILYCWKLWITITCSQLQNSRATYNVTVRVKLEMSRRRRTYNQSATTDWLKIIVCQHA